MTYDKAEKAERIATSDLIGAINPPTQNSENGIAKGFQQSKWFNLKGQNNQTDGTNKNESKVSGRSNPE